MTYQDVKKQFLKKYSYELIRLDNDEVESIPKTSIQDEYLYLKNRDYIFKEGHYYKKVTKDLSDEAITPLTNMLILKEYGQLGCEIDKGFSKLETYLKWIIGVMMIIIVLLLLIIFLL